MTHACRLVRFGWFWLGRFGWLARWRALTHVPEKHPKAESSKAGSAADEPEVMDVIPFDLVSPSQTKAMMKAWVMCGLWRVQTVCGTGPDALFCTAAGACIMNKTLVAQRMCLVPFSTDLQDKKPDSLCAKITAEVGQGNVLTYWAVPVSDTFTTAAGPERQAICPFFCADASGGGGIVPVRVVF